MLQCLEDLDNPGNSLASRAAGLKAQLASASILFALKVVLKEFVPLENLNRSLQSAYKTVPGMLEVVQIVKDELMASRSDASFQCLLESLVHMQVDLDLDPLEVPRQRKPPARFTGPAASTVASSVTEHYRPLYFALLDSAVTHLNVRFRNGAGLQKYSHIEQMLLTGDVEACRDILAL